MGIIVYLLLLFIIYLPENSYAVELLEKVAQLVAYMNIMCLPWSSHTAAKVYLHQLGELRHKMYLTSCVAFTQRLCPCVISVCLSVHIDIERVLHP